MASDDEDEANGDGIYKVIKNVTEDPETPGDEQVKFEYSIFWGCFTYISSI